MNRGWCSGGGRRAWWALSGLALGGALVASAAAGGDPGRVTNTGVVGRPAHPSPLLTDTGVVGRPARPAPLPAAGASPARTRQFTDTFAPGWQIVVTQLAADRYHLYLEQSVLAAGGVGEARQAFARCGQHLAREQGGEHFAILQYDEGLIGGLLVAQRVASGEIQVGPPAPGR